jgi:low affinity Fe/Cu permease
MKKKFSAKISDRFDNFAHKTTVFAGSSAAFSIAFLVIIIWIISGPIFNYSNTWQLVINTGTTVITFLMVFLIQRSQNKESLAVQLKLNELVASSSNCSNRLIDIEDLTQDELEHLHKFYIQLAKKAEKESNLKETHSVEEEHIQKVSARKKKK